MAGCGCSCGTGNGLTAEQRMILEALRKSDKPAGTKEIVAATGLEKDVVSGTITGLKKKGLLDSPERCKYGITGDGVNSLGC